MARRKRDLFGSIVQREGRPGWYVRITYRGKRRWFYGGLKSSEAEAVRAELAVRISKGLPLDDPLPGGDVMFEEFLKDHVQHLEREHTASTFRSERDRLQNVILPFFQGMKLGEIGLQDVERFLLDRGRRGASPATRNRYTNVLSRLFERAKAYGHVEENPVSKVTKPREQERPVPALPFAVQDALVEAAPVKIRDYILLSLETGCRQSELLALEWTDVDLDVGELTVRKAKGGKTRIVPTTARALACLKALKEEARRREPPETRVLFRLPRTWNGRLRKLFERAATAIGYPGLRPHDLRHLSAVNMVRAGIPLPDVGRWLGHEAGSIGVTMRYAKHQPENAAHAAREKLDRSRDTIAEGTGEYAA